MRQSVQISKLNGFRSGFMAFLAAASLGFSAHSVAADPAAKPAKPRSTALTPSSSLKTTKMAHVQMRLWPVCQPLYQNKT